MCFELNDLVKMGDVCMQATQYGGSASVPRNTDGYGDSSDGHDYDPRKSMYCKICCYLKKLLFINLIVQVCCVLL